MQIIIENKVTVDGVVIIEKEIKIEDTTPHLMYSLGERAIDHCANDCKQKLKEATLG